MRTRWCFSINEQKYLTELSRLLGFMSSWDREAMIEKYKDMFAAAEDREQLMEEIGTPTQVAISIANNYVPSPRPQVVRPMNEDSEEDGEEDDEDYYEGEAEEASAFFPTSGNDEEDTPEASFGPRRQLRPAVTGVYILLCLVIGLPIAVVLLVIGLPVIAVGGGCIAASLYAFVRLVSKLGMFSDVLMLIGSGLVLFGIGLLILWLGIWIDISLERLWIGKALVGWGRKLCYREEES